MEEDKNPIFIKDLGMHYPTENSKRKARFGLYKCGYCGKEFRAITNSVKTKPTKSCGCLRGEGYNLTKHRLYNTWYRMNYRCTNPNSQDYLDYGSRGILVCEEWQDVRNFIEWVDSTHPNIEGYTLDRIDNDKGYSPDNCRWVDMFIQNTNKRKRKDNTSGHTGIVYRELLNKYVATISSLGVRQYLGIFENIKEAVEVRDNYIIENNLPHKLSKDYKERINENI